MATARISKRSVDAAGPGRRDSYLWDDDLSGFGVKITPAGSKTYLIQYRLGGRLPALDPAVDVGLEHAAAVGDAEGVQVFFNVAGQAEIAL